MHAATRSEVQIRAWAESGQLGNLGVATGAESNLIVIDLDDSALEDELGQIANAQTALRETVRYRTPRGLHIYYRYRPGLRNTVRLAGTALDVRTDGGYVVVPPSRVADDYRWEAGRAPWQQPVAPLPDWLYAHLKQGRRTVQPSTPRSPSCRPADGPSNFGRRLLRCSWDELARARAGSRNDKLNRVAFRLGRLMEAGGLTERCVVNALVGAPV